VFSGPLLVLLARRTNRKAVLVGFAGLWGLWACAAGFAQNFVQLLILYTIAAAGFAGGQPIVTEILADLFDDRTRGRAAGYLYGIIALVTAVLGPALGQLSRIPDGWRFGFFASGALCVAFGVLVAFFFHDPGLGASEPQLAGLDRRQREAGAQLSWARVRELLKIRTFALMLVQRLLSGHLLIISFGVVFLVDVYHYSNAVASIVLLPFNAGYFLGTVIGGLIADRIHRAYPGAGRVAMLQAAQLAFAVVAFFGTQFDWGSIAVFAVFYGALGFLQGCNPGINRPIVMSVTPPELRSTAFALMIAVVEAIAWAIFSFGAGFLGQTVGLKTTFLWALVLLMVANAAFVTLLYRPYVRDRAALQAELNRRSG
jgi:predicted MFS family arabinose efflux permease